MGTIHPSPVNGTIASTSNTITDYHPIKMQKFIKNYVFELVSLGSPKLNMDSVQVGKGFNLPLERLLRIVRNAQHCWITHR